MSLMRIKLVLAGVLLASTAGCELPGPGRGETFLSPTEVRAKDEANCRYYGFRKGTDAFANCLMQQDHERGETRRMDSLEASMPRPSSSGGMQAPKIAPQPPFRPTCWPPLACVN
jgi:hypothetical protein